MGQYSAYIDKSSILKTYLVQDCVYRSGTLNDATEALENYLQNKEYKFYVFVCMPEKHNSIDSYQFIVAN